MNQRTRNNIAHSATIILNEFDISIPIVDIDDVISRLNGSIIEVPDYIEDGSIHRTPDSDSAFVIKLSNTLPTARRNFAIAQKLGTLFLHMGYMTDWDLWDSLDVAPYTPESIYRVFEAHQFASHFLMPTHYFLDYVNTYAVDGIIDTYQLADYFGVTDSVAINHGKWIGGLQWT